MRREAFVFSKNKRCSDFKQTDQAKISRRALLFKVSSVTSWFCPPAETLHEKQEEFILGGEIEAATDSADVTAVGAGPGDGWRHINHPDAANKFSCWDEILIEAAAESLCRSFVPLRQQKLPMLMGQVSADRQQRRACERRSVAEKCTGSWDETGSCRSADSSRLVYHRHTN